VECSREGERVKIDRPPRLCFLDGLLCHCNEVRIS
jgi:hypothetical protein